jgi:hypothetical protein
LRETRPISSRTTNPLDPTINASYLYNESKIFNFGHVMLQKDLDGNDHLIYEVADPTYQQRSNPTGYFESFP